MKIEIIAEIGQNHNGDLTLAKELIHAAKESGAAVAKFQLYDAATLFSKNGNEWYDYNLKTELTLDQLYEVNDECSKVGIEFMASVFDVDRVSWLEDIKVRRYKLASRSINENSLIEAIKSTGKRIIVSLGMWNKDAFPTIQSPGGVDFLYCISKYPTELADLNFKDIDFSKYDGFSDHTVGIAAAQIAVARGAKIVEKHFTLDKNMYGPDHKGSMTPKELHDLAKFRTQFLTAFG